MSDNEVACYVYTFEKLKGKGHFETLLVSNEEVFQLIPSTYATRSISFAQLFYGKSLYSTLPQEVFEVGYGQVNPQGDEISCATLGASYMKELLKNNAEQFKSMIK